MELSHEERAELHGLRNRRFWATLTAVVAAVLVVLTVTEGPEWSATVVAGLLLVGAVMVRVKTAAHIGAVEARVRDRSAGQTPA